MVLTKLMLFIYIRIMLEVIQIKGMKEHYPDVNPDEHPYTNIMLQSISEKIIEKAKSHITDDVERNVRKECKKCKKRQKGGSKPPSKRQRKSNRIDDSDSELNDAKSSDSD